MRPKHNLALIPVSFLVAGLSMAGPAILALIDEDYSTFRNFIYCGLLVVVFAIITGLASRNVRLGSASISRLIELVIVFVAVPALLAIPVNFIVESTSLIDAYFEMVSCFTTTGASVFYQVPNEAIISSVNESHISDSVSFWRAQVAWMGGLLIWIAAAEILSPLGIGGFEIIGERKPTNVAQSISAEQIEAKHRFRGIWILSLVYSGLTIVLWLFLIGAGDQPISSLVSAMSTLSTSGITLAGGYSNPSNSLAGEVFIGAFLILTLSRLLVTALRWGPERVEGVFDREIRLAFILILISVLFSMFFQYQQLAAIRTWSQLVDILLGLWGVIFSSVSFLSTTGFQPLYWSKVISFQPDNFVNIILVGLALVGGGVATTTGGLKLLRVDELLRFGYSELGRLAYPSTILAEQKLIGGGRGERIVLSGVFLMLFLIMLAFFSLILSLSGMGFEESMILSISSVTNTGPLANVSLGTGFSHSQLSDQIKLLLCLAMIVGRLELLALITLISPFIWNVSGSKIVDKGNKIS